MSNQASTGIYQPLNVERRELRLLRMLYNNAGTVDCQIQVFSLDDEPEYTALSYVWTEARASKAIFVNDQPLIVRPNLYEYLLQMRSEKRENWLFADAICINQDDDDERSAQVALMGSVYGKAAEVVAWMGTCCGDPDFDENDMRKIEKLFVTGVPNPQNLKEDKVLSYAFEMCFFGSSYWSRLWVVQEILLARELWLQFRGLRLSAEDALAYALSDGYDIPTADLAFFLHTLIKGNTSLADHGGTALWCLSLRKNSTDAQNHPKLSIGEAISMVAHQRCSRKRDRIFGILGIVNSNMRPDYSMPMIELYMRTLAEWEIENAREELETEPALSTKLLFHLGLINALGLTLRHPITALLMTGTLTRTKQDILRRKWKTDIHFERNHIYHYGFLLCLDEGHFRKPNMLLARSQAVFVLSRLRAAKISGAKIKDPAGSGDRKTLQEWISMMKNIREDVYQTAEARAREKADELQALLAEMRLSIAELEATLNAVSEVRMKRISIQRQMSAMDVARLRLSSCPNERSSTLWTQRCEY